MEMNVGLSSGASGPEVGRLHRVLEAAGLVIEVGEKERQSFGNSTLVALLEFQRQRGLLASGEVDAATYAALVVIELATFVESEPPKTPEPADRGAAQIALVDEDGEPIDGARVSLF